MVVGVLGKPERFGAIGFVTFRLPRRPEELNDRPNNGRVRRCGNRQRFDGCHGQVALRAIGERDTAGIRMGNTGAAGRDPAAATAAAVVVDHFVGQIEVADLPAPACRAVASVVGHRHVFHFGRVPVAVDVGLVPVRLLHFGQYVHPIDSVRVLGPVDVAVGAPVGVIRALVVGVVAQVSDIASVVVGDVDAPDSRDIVFQGEAYLAAVGREARTAQPAVVADNIVLDQNRVLLLRLQVEQRNAVALDFTENLALHSEVLPVDRCQYPEAGQRNRTQAFRCNRVFHIVFPQDMVSAKARFFDSTARIYVVQVFRSAPSKCIWYYCSRTRPRETASMARRQSRSVVRARIAEVIDERICAGKRMLPGVRQLAARLGCARATVVAALADLAAQGLVEPTPGRGTRIIRAPNHADTPTRASDRRSRAARLIATLLSDLCTGTLAEPLDALPDLKQLMTRYGVGRSLLLQCLETLETQGVLQRFGRRYRLRSAVGRSMLELHLVAVGDNRGELGQQTPHQLPLLTAVEEECRRHAIRFRAHILKRHFGAPRLSRHMERDLTRAAAQQGVAQFMLWNLFMGPDVLQRLRRILAATDTPTAFLDDSGALSDASMRALPRSWQVFDIAYSPVAGRVAARYLVEHGHRHVAWVDSWSSARWERNRYAGFAETLHALTGGYPILPHRPPEHPGRVRSSADTALRDAVAAHAAQVSFAPRSAAARREFVDEVTNVLDRQETRERQRRLLEPSMAKLLENTAITAWAASNDGVAIECLDFLARQRCAVPGRISVIGFDDSHLSVRRHLTTYNHNCPALAAAMVNHVLDPGLSHRAWEGRRVVAVPGFIRERRTVASIPLDD
ncbi:MAG: GntR family transcriptional regulator [Chitinivibrionales bacterium]|nr:GntR family transcriptional regulator [Chitinivibrionales bacterium]